MKELHVSLLGPFQGTYAGKPLDSFRTSKVQALLIYLAMQQLEGADGQIGREQVMTRLWPEKSGKRARDNLRQTLYHLRKTIPEVSGGAGGSRVPFVLGDRQQIWINPEAAYSLDVARFARLIEAGGPEELAEAVDLYRGDFLADFYLEDSSAFENWAADWRARLRRQMLAALDQLAELHLEQGQAEQAAAYARRQLALDDLREGAHRQLMVALSRLGKRAEAIRQYERCRALLEKELGVAPAAETKAVLEGVREGAGVVAGEERTSALAIARARSRLPEPDNPLIGREREVADLIAFLEGDARLVSIVGPGGIGKTRLALEVAHRWVADAGCRATFVNLAPLTEADDIASAVIRALELEFERRDREGLLTRLVAYLQEERLLLLLDNFEQLVAGGAPLLIELLQAAPEVKLLVTSRERLELRAEHVYPLSGLVYSDWTTPVEAGQDAAVQLFHYHARRVRPAFRIRSEDLGSLQRIVRLTDGLPLALILAAGWVRVLDTAEIAAELDRSLDFLQATHRDVPPRQQSMRAVFDSTWARLSEREQALFAALSVFRDGFTLAAAQSVAGASTGDMLQLLDSSLVSRGKGERFEVHELLRQFAGERLEERGEAEAARAAHSAYYCELLGQREDDLKGPQAAATKMAIDADLENVRVAWTWAADKRQEALLARAAHGLGLYFARAKFPAEGSERFLYADEKLSADPAVSPRLRAQLLIWPAISLSYDPAGRKLGEQYARQVLALLDREAEAGEDARVERAWALLALGNNVRADYRQARRHFQTSLSLFSQLGLTWEMGWAHERLGANCVTPADYRSAVAHYTSAQRLFERAGDPRYALLQKLYMAMVSASTGQLEEAEKALREGVALLQARGDRPLLAWAQLRLAEALLLGGRFRQSLSLLTGGQASLKSSSNAFTQAMSSLLSTWATLHTGRYREAQQEARSLLVAAREQEVHYYIGLLTLVWGCAALALHDLDEAGEALRESARAFATTDQRDELGWARAVQGYIALYRGDPPAARNYLVEAMRFVSPYHHYTSALIALPGVALLFAELGEKERALEVHALASAHGFVANSCWFEDVAGRRLAALAEKLPVEKVDAARTVAEGQDLWEASDALLQELKHVDL